MRLWAAMWLVIALFFVVVGALIVIPAKVPLVNVVLFLLTMAFLLIALFPKLVGSWAWC